MELLGPLLMWFGIGCGLHGLSSTLDLEPPSRLVAGLVLLPKVVVLFIRGGVTIKGRRFIRDLRSTFDRDLCPTFNPLASFGNGLRPARPLEHSGPQVCQGGFKSRRARRQTYQVFSNSTGVVQTYQRCSTLPRPLEHSGPRRFAIRSFDEQLPNHRHRTSKAFTKHIQTHVLVCFITE